MLTEKGVFCIALIFFVEDSIKVQVFYGNLTYFWFPIKGLALYWHNTETQWKLKREIKCIIFVNIYYILCRTGLFV